MKPYPHLVILVLAGGLLTGCLHHGSATKPGTVQEQLVGGWSYHDFFTGIVIEFGDGWYRHEFYSDIMIGDEATYPIMGTYKVEGNRITLATGCNKFHELVDPTFLYSKVWYIIDNKDESCLIPEAEYGKWKATGRCEKCVVLRYRPYFDPAEPFDAQSYSAPGEPVVLNITDMSSCIPKDRFSVLDVICRAEKSGDCETMHVLPVVGEVTKWHGELPTSLGKLGKVTPGNGVLEVTTMDSVVETWAAETMKSAKIGKNEVGRVQIVPQSKANKKKIIIDLVKDAGRQ